MGIFLVILALLPGLALVVYLYRRDVLEPEPRGRVALAVVSGLLAGVVAIVLSVLVGIGSGLKTESWSVGQLAWLTARIGLVEEGSKLAIAALFFFPGREFNEPMDGVVYVGAVSLGFAILENVGYVLAGGLGAGLLRAVTAVPMHAFVGALAGYYLGLAKGRGLAGLFLVLLGWLVAAAIHAGYDFAAFYFRSTQPLLGLGICFGVVVATWAILKLAIRSALRRSPFEAMRHNFRVVSNEGGGLYRFECQLCGHVFPVRLQGRVVCPQDTCMNYYDWETRGGRRRS